jgi:nucleotide-binding universal stress UspA family protein
MQQIIESVLHPTDFSEGSKVAFFHALKATLLSRSHLTLLNVSSDDKPRWADFPGVRETLEKWQLLPKGSPRSAVNDLGIDIRKAIMPKGNPVEGVINYMTDYPAEMIVLATQQRRGISRWLSSSVAEPIARRATEMTLFIPGGTDGFVSGEDGSVSLKNILIPVATSPRPQPALEAAARLVRSLDVNAGTFTLLHIGNANSMPAVNTPDIPGWSWKKEIRSGDIIQSIIDMSRETKADLIVMSTDGRNGFLDGLRGSHSERVLRQAGVPLLTVPLGSLVYDTIA